MRSDPVMDAFSRWKAAWDLCQSAQADLNARIAQASLTWREPPPPEAYANVAALARQADRLLLEASHLLNASLHPRDDARSA